MKEIEKVDLVVVGSGFSGLAVAKTYLQVNQDANVLILDSQSSIGGVWARERVYPLLVTQNTGGSFEFSDFPMVGFGEEKDQHIPGDVVCRYLEAYAEKFDLIRRTRFNHKVETAEQQADNSWLLTISLAGPGGKKTESQIFASKLVVASGLTSEPFMPVFAGQESFESPVFHSKDFGVHADTVHTAKDVVVLSGMKSAWDVVYAYATAGVQVHWVIRKSGHGPCWMSPKRVTPFKILAGWLFTTRFITWLSPCIWGDSDGYAFIRWLFRATWVGRKFVDFFSWNVMQAGVEEHNGYDKHPETAKLKPWHDIFWSGTNRGLLNYDKDIFELVRQGKIKVHVADVTRLAPRSVHLSDGTVLPADAMVCCTGWRHCSAITFTRDGQDIRAELGLPHEGSTLPNHITGKLVAQADAEILRTFPRLRDQPSQLAHLAPLPPAHAGDPTTAVAETGLAGSYCLYRLMIPPAHIHTRTIAFAGALRTASTALLAQTQALWITAFFGHQLPHLSVPAAGSSTCDSASAEEADGNAADADASADAKQPLLQPQDPAHRLTAQTTYEAVLHARFGKWRYPHGFGAVVPDFFFDALPLLDLMLKELGLRRWRKRNAVREALEWYGPRDYVGLVEEWAEGKKDGEGEGRK